MPPSSTPKDPFERMRRALDRGGLKGLETASSRIEKAATKAQAPFAKLANAIDDPRYRKAAANALAVEEATRKLNVQTRERLGLEGRRQSVANGSYGRELRAQQLLARERERVESIERRAQFNSRYGSRIGGAAHAVDELSRSRFAQIGGSVGNSITGRAMKGFEGTVELNRYRLETQLIARELAGAFRPAIEVTTIALHFFRRQLERLSPRQQNALMIGGLGLAGLGALGAARAGLGVVGQLTGSIAGGAAGGAGAATAARYRAIAMRGARWLKYLDAWNDAATDIRTDPSTTRSIVRQGPVRGLDFFAGGEFARMAGYKRGSIIGQSYDAIFGENPEKNKFRDAAKEEERRKVTLADAGFEAVGSGRDRMISALALVDANDTSKSDTTVLEDIFNLLKDVYPGLLKANPTVR